MPKPLANFLTTHLQIFLTFALLFFVRSSLTEIFRRAAPGVDVDAIMAPWRVLLGGAFALWLVYFSARLFLGVRSGRLLVG